MRPADGADGLVPGNAVMAPPNTHAGRALWLAWMGESEVERWRGGGGSSRTPCQRFGGNLSFDYDDHSFTEHHGAVAGSRKGPQMTSQEWSLRSHPAIFAVRPRQSGAARATRRRRRGPPDAAVAPTHPGGGPSSLLAFSSPSPASCRLPCSGRWGAGGAASRHLGRPRRVRGSRTPARDPRLSVPRPFPSPAGGLPTWRIVRVGSRWLSCRKGVLHHARH